MPSTQKSKGGTPSPRTGSSEAALTNKFVSATQCRTRSGKLLQKWGLCSVRQAPWIHDLNSHRLYTRFQPLR